MKKIVTSRAPDCMVQKYIGSAFNEVKAVADNIDDIIKAADAIGDFPNIVPYLPDINTLADNIDTVKTTSDNIDTVKTTADNMNAVKITSDNMNAIVDAPNQAQIAIDSANTAKVSETKAEESYQNTLKVVPNLQAQIDNRVTYPDLIANQNDIVGGSIFRGSNGETVEIGDVVGPGTTHLRISSGGGTSIVSISPVVSGSVSALSESSAIIGGEKVLFKPWNSNSAKDLFGVLLSKFRQFGHRGSELSHPENTLSALNACRGMDGAEFDVRLTSDGVWCLMHDTNLNRTTTGLGPIALNTFKYVRAQDAGSWFDPYFSGVKVPTLSEALNACKQANLIPMVELKAIGTTQQNKDLLDQCKKYFPGYNFIIATSNQSWLEEMLLIDPNILVLRFVSGTADSRIPEMQAIKPCIVSVERSALTEADIKKYHDNGFITYVHTLEGNEERELWMSRGVDGVLSNNLTGAVL